MRITANLHAALERSGMSQRDFAAHLGAHEVTLSEWLTGGHEPDLLRAYTAARVLGVTIDELCLAEVLPERAGSSECRLPDWGASIRHLLDTTDLTVIWLAHESGVAATTIYMWIRAPQYPRLSTALRIAEALGRTMHEICDGVGQDQAWMVAS